MRLARTLLLLTLLIFMVGLIRGWFSVSSYRDSETKRVDVQFTVDPAKVQDDADKLKEETSELGERVTERVEDLTRRQN